MPIEKIKVDNEYIQIETAFDNFSIGQHIHNNEYESWILKFARLVLTNAKNPIIFDIGSNVGLISLPLSRIYKKGTIYSFEALPQCVNVLEKNIELNHIQNIHVVKKAVSSSTQTLEINLPSGLDLGNAFISQPAMNETDSLKKMDIDSITIDEYVKSNNIDKIDFIKIDVEGWEEHVLIGATQSIQKFNPCCIIEFNITQINDDIENRGYLLWKKLRSLFNKIYLIDRLSLNLFEINNFAELRSLMLTGHNVEDLLCFNNQEIYKKIKSYIIPHRYSCYGAAEVIRKENKTLSLLSYYPDGWTHGHHMAIVSGFDKLVNIEVECFWYPPESNMENHAMVYSSSKETWVVTEKIKKHNLVLSPNEVIFIWCTRSRKASTVFRNSDPRNIGFNMKILNISTDVGEN